MRANRGYVLLVALLTLAVFWPVVTFNFVTWDDPSNVTGNPLLNPVTAENIQRIWSASYDAMYIPVSYTAWALAALVGRTETPSGGSALNPAVFHAINLALHVGTALIVWRILAELLKASQSTNTDDPPKNSPHATHARLHGTLAATIGALVFAIHPVQVETVAWVSALRDLLAGLFGMLALWRFLKLRAKPQPSEIALAIIALVLALLSKPSAVVIPLMAIMINLWRTGRWTRGEIQVLTAWFLMVIPCLLWTHALQPGGPQFGAQSPVSQRPYIALDAIGFYIEKLIWPAKLGFEYGQSPARVITEKSIRWIFPLIAIVAALATRNRRRWLAIIGLILAALLPVLGFVPFNYQFYSTVADHYLYLPMLGIALAIAGWLANHPSRRCFFLGTIVVVVFAARSFAQCWTWQDSQTLFSHNLKVNPCSFVSHLHLAESLMREKKFPDAENHLQAALEIKPDYSLARTDLAILLLKTGRIDQGLDQWLLSIDEARAEDPTADLSPVYKQIGAMLIQRGRIAEGLQCLREAAKKHPEDDELKKQIHVAEMKLTPPPPTAPSR